MAAAGTTRMPRRPSRADLSLDRDVYRETVAALDHDPLSAAAGWYVEELDWECLLAAYIDGQVT